MKRQKRKSRKKLSMLWDEAMDFEVAITPSVEPDPSLEDKIIALPLPQVVVNFPLTPPQPPMAA